MARYGCQEGPRTIGQIVIAVGDCFESSIVGTHTGQSSSSVLVKTIRWAWRVFRSELLTVPSVTFVRTKPRTNAVKLAAVIVSVWLTGRVRKLQFPVRSRYLQNDARLVGSNYIANSGSVHALDRVSRLYPTLRGIHPYIRMLPLTSL